MSLVGEQPVFEEPLDDADEEVPEEACEHRNFYYEEDDFGRGACLVCEDCDESRELSRQEINSRRYNDYVATLGRW